MLYLTYLLAFAIAISMVNGANSNEITPTPTTPPAQCISTTLNDITLYLVHDGKDGLSLSDKGCSAKWRIREFVSTHSSPGPCNVPKECIGIQTADSNSYLYDKSDEGKLVELPGTDLEKDGRGAYFTLRKNRLGDHEWQIYNIWYGVIGVQPEEQAKHDNPLLCTKLTGKGYELEWRATDVTFCGWDFTPKGTKNMRQNSRLLNPSVVTNTISNTISAVSTVSDILSDDQISILESAPRCIGTIPPGSNEIMYLVHYDIDKIRFSKTCDAKWELQYHVQGKDCTPHEQCWIIRAAGSKFYLYNYSEAGQKLTDNRGRGAWFQIIDTKIKNNDFSGRLLNVHLNSIDSNPLLCSLTTAEEIQVFWQRIDVTSCNWFFTEER